MKKKIEVKHITDSIDENCLSNVSNLLDTYERHELQYKPWPQFSGKPKVSFAIAHNSTNIFLKYFVEEKNIRVVNTLANSPVFEDSCVEFFVSFDDGATYYNFEFNCTGTALVGYGTSKDDRQLLDTNLVNNLETKSIITSENGNGFAWQLTIILPLSIFIHSSIQKLADISCEANFYKCGDLLPEPHFISWSNIIAEAPNFHLPEYFGRLVFQ